MQRVGWRGDSTCFLITPLPPIRILFSHRQILSAFSLFFFSDAHRQKQSKTDTGHMSGLIPSAPPSQQDGYDYVASISKSAGVGGGARKMQKAEEHKYHYYTEDEDDGGGRGKCALYDNLEKGGGGGGGDKHQPISQDDARLLRLEHMAEVNHHRLDALEQQGQGRSTRGRKRAGTMMLWVLVTALFACYLLLMAGLIAIFFFSTHGIYGKKKIRNHPFLNYY